MLLIESAVWHMHLNYAAFSYKQRLCMLLHGTKNCAALQSFQRGEELNEVMSAGVPRRWTNDERQNHACALRRQFMLAAVLFGLLEMHLVARLAAVEQFSLSVPSGRDTYQRKPG